MRHKKFFLKEGDPEEGILYRIKIWRFYIWITDYRKTNKEYMKKKLSINCWGISRK